MVFEDHETADDQPLFFLEEAPGIEYQANRFGPREDREPSYDGASQEVRVDGFTNLVSAFRHRLALPETRSVGDVIPTQSVGTRALVSLVLNRIQVSPRSHALRGNAIFDALRHCWRAARRYSFLLGIPQGLDFFSARRPVPRDAERRGCHSHAERGNESPSTST